MPVRQLTAAFVQQATCPPHVKKIEYRDTQIIGFSLEVRASGGKTFYLRYFNSSGRQRQLKLGGVKDITFDQARKKARDLRAEAVLGGDPLAEKEERKAIPTYAKLAEQHLAEAKSSQIAWSSTESILRIHLTSRWGNLRLNEIKSLDISKWLGELSATYKPSTVQKISAVFHRSFELAKRWNIPGGDRNPVHGISRPKFSNARHRYLTADEILRLRAACEKSANPQLASIVGLLVLTGVRRGELFSARWKDIDLERRLWFIPRTKNGQSRHVPLSKPALAIIEALPRSAKSEFVITSAKSGKPYVSVKKSWATALKEAGIEDCVLHDLRHTCASQMVNAGIDLFAVSRILGHRDLSSSRRYSHLANETLFKAVEAGANNQAAWTALSS